jgi:guanylate kinase
MTPPSPDHPDAGERHRLPTDTDDGLLLIISGPSGVGKTTITRAVERSIPGAVFSVSATTRPKTAADVEGVDYHFVSDAEFDDLVAHDAFLEWANVFGKRYGTLRAWVDEQLARGRMVILEIDVPGAMKVKQQLPGAFAMFVLPPDEATLLERLRNRKREAEDGIQRRFAEARREISQATTSGVYDAFVTNRDLECAIEEAVRLVKGELAKRRGRRA